MKIIAKNENILQSFGFLLINFVSRHIWFLSEILLQKVRGLRRPWFTCKGLPPSLPRFLCFRYLQDFLSVFLNQGSPVLIGIETV